MTACALMLALAVAPTPFYWPKPDVVEEIDVPDVIRSDGIPVRLHVIRSKRSIQELLNLYVSAFERAGFYVQRVQRRLVAEPHVTGLDWQGGLISYSAILSPNPDGTTTCLLGEAAVGKRKPAGSDDFAPLFPGARETVRLDQEGARIITYEAPKTTADEVLRFYGEQLKTLGYKAKPGSGAPSKFEKNGAELDIVPKAQAGGAVSVVLLLRPLQP
jgi:hypothetical protein